MFAVGEVAFFTAAFLFAYYLSLQISQKEYVWILRWSWDNKSRR